MKHDPSWITKEAISERLAYDQETGLFTWKVCRYASNIGKITNSQDASGYVQIRVRGTTCKAHRLAWLMVHGKMPKGQIDHINGIRNDNRIANLREVNNAINCQNKRSPLPSNKLGVLGVRYHRGAYTASIQLNKKQHHLGRFKTLDEASAAYINAKRRLHEGCSI
jgi:hypothetical protein